MPNFRRAYVPGGTFFFTVVTANRAPILCQPVARRALHDSIDACRKRWPFEVVAIVLLPDHVHTIWTLPDGDANFSLRWAWIKKEFTKAWLAAGGAEQTATPGQQHDGRRGVWQEKFWEHAIRDERDLERHIDYIHLNPVKHGLVSRAADWAFSSFHRWVKQGAYEPTWGDTGDGGSSASQRFDDIAASARE